MEKLLNDPKWGACMIGGLIFGHLIAKHFYL